MKRNIGMTTNADHAKENILRFLASAADMNQPARKSAIGYAAFPEYSFKTPQGAAFSVAALVREMEDDGLVRHVSTSYSTGYVLTSTGRVAAAELQPHRKMRIEMDIKTLIAVATGKIPHNYRSGLCPDELQPDSRDPDCPACKILIYMEEQERKGKQRERCN